MERSPCRHLGTLVAALSPALVAPTSALAQPGGRGGDEEHARVRLVSATRSLVPGDRAYLGLLFDIDDGWHIYWEGVNDSGFAPKVSWTAPRGVTVSPMLLPVPTRYVGAGDLLDHIYEHQVLLIVPVDVPNDAVPGSLLTFRGEVEWLVCKDSCIPGYADVLITLPVANDAGTESAGATEFFPLFERTLGRVPVLWQGQDARFSLKLSASSVEIAAPGATRLTYYPQSEAARAENLLRRGVSADGRLLLRLHPQDRGQVARDPNLRFVIEAKFPGEESSVVYVIDRPLSELDG